MIVVSMIGILLVSLVVIIIAIIGFLLIWEVEIIIVIWVILFPIP